MNILGLSISRCGFALPLYQCGFNEGSPHLVWAAFSFLLYVFFLLFGCSSKFRVCLGFDVERRQSCRWRMELEHRCLDTEGKHLHYDNYAQNATISILGLCLELRVVPNFVWTKHWRQGAAVLVTGTSARSGPKSSY